MRSAAPEQEAEGIESSLRRKRANGVGFGGGGGQNTAEWSPVDDSNCVYVKAQLCSKRKKLLPSRPFHFFGLFLIVLSASSVMLSLRDPDLL